MNHPVIGVKGPREQTILGIKRLGRSGSHPKVQRKSISGEVGVAQVNVEENY